MDAQLRLAEINAREYPTEENRSLWLNALLRAGHKPPLLIINPEEFGLSIQQYSPAWVVLRTERQGTLQRQVPCGHCHRKKSDAENCAQRWIYSYIHGRPYLWRQYIQWP